MPEKKAFYHTTLMLKDEAATTHLGQLLAQRLEPGVKIYLEGELGAGKTSLVRALLHACGVEGHIKSPTYALVESYEGYMTQKKLAIMHFDLYRMQTSASFLEAGFREVFDGETVCLVEWPLQAVDVLPLPDVWIHFDVLHNVRQVRLDAWSERGVLCLKQLHFMPNV